MVFSSPLFLFLFLPSVLLLYYALPAALGNVVLLATSLLFYAWGETQYLLLMLFVIAVNYFAALAIDHMRRKGYGEGPVKAVFVLGVAINLGLLAAFKYAGFLAASANPVLAALGLPLLSISALHLPVGISFYTFQALSYSMDVYRKAVPVQRDPFSIGLYITFFPQLIAGPIVRYQDISRALSERRTTVSAFASGVRRFIVGLGKKVLIANTVATGADMIFKLPPDQLNFTLAWVGVLCYTLQIYFDFSAYSDMAIGLGRMFGFDFIENFNYPYVAQSIKEFWRRWHISLSIWFRDYLYIPLGGNRGGPLGTYGNLLIVFFLCGLWHGASWTFVAWGLYHGAFLVLERTRFDGWLARLPRPFRHAYALTVVAVGWVFFRADTFAHAAAFLQAMASPSTFVLEPSYFGGVLRRDIVLAAAIGIVFSTPVVPALLERFQRLGKDWAAGGPNRASALAIVATADAGLCVIFLLSAMALAAGLYNPFIYYRF